MEPPPAPGSPSQQVAEGIREATGVLRSVLDDTQLLLQKHIELARQELIAALDARIKAVAAGAVAAVAGLFALGFLASALAYGLDHFMPDWVARLVVGVLFLVVAGLAALFGRQRMIEPPLAPEATKQALKEDTEWARTRLGR